MVLNGIGGYSIAHAKKNLTQAEVTIWSAYRNKRGSLNIGRRVEQSIGGFSALYVESKSKPGTEVDPVHFMVHEDQPEPEGLSIFDFEDEE